MGQTHLRQWCDRSGVANMFFHRMHCLFCNMLRGHVLCMRVRNMLDFLYIVATLGRHIAKGNSASLNFVSCPQQYYEQPLI